MTLLQRPGGKNNNIHLRLKMSMNILNNLSLASVSWSEPHIGVLAMKFLHLANGCHDIPP